MTGEDLPAGVDEHVKTTADHKVRHTHKHDHDHSIKIKTSKEKDMLGSVGGTPVITGGDSGMGLGAGLGGGLLGGILGGALLGNRGLLGGAGGAVDGVTPAFVTSAVNEATNDLQHTMNMQTLGDIKASIPLNEAQVQLALGGSTAQIIAQTNALSAQGFNAQLANLQSFANTKDATDALSTQVAVGQGVTNVNIERLGWQLSKEITTDGAATRALIQSIDKQNDMARITAQANEIIELRNENRRTEDRHGVEITMVNNQNQNQLQFQQQSQVLSTVTSCLNGLAQNIHAQNQAINIGGFQSANPTNTNTNVRG